MSHGLDLSVLREWIRWQVPIRVRSRGNTCLGIPVALVKITTADGVERHQLSLQMRTKLIHLDLVEITGVTRQ
jgi:hypothetical protein